jgi:DAACS family dicarboxylate/amino acid:cation (Na+ or H+) symporter
MSALIRTPLQHWQSMPLYLRTLIGMAIGAICGATMGPDAAALAKPGSILMGLVQMLAAPVAFFAIVHALAGAKIEQGKTGALVKLLATNTLVAILIGLLVANFIRPGERRGLSDSDKARVEAQAVSMAGQIATAETSAKESGPGDKVLQILEKLPRSVMGPFTDGGSVIGVIVLALMLGLALRKVSPDPDATVRTVKVVQLVPVIVLGVVAGEVGLNGFGSFYSLLWLILAVLLALALQFIYYMSRIWLQSWVSPAQLVSGCRDALAMAFSTASSTATMPLTYQCLIERVKVRKSSANLGALVGANFNNDGTALYEAMAALFIAQLLGRDLDFAQQAVVVLCAVAASVGAAGIPSAGLITMTLVFTAVGLPLEYSLLLVPIDWFLDRFRTMINVSGDLCVSCVLDGRQKPAEGET